MRELVLCVSFASVVVACSAGTTNDPGTRVALDVNGVCDRIVNKCHGTGTVDECAKGLDLVRVSPDCTRAINAASCDDLIAKTPSFTATCFPPCSTPGTTQCNGDGTATVCDDAMQTLVLDCGATCQLAGRTWSGVCGKTFQTQTATKDKCWCS